MELLQLSQSEVDCSIANRLLLLLHLLIIVLCLTARQLRLPNVFNYPVKLKQSFWTFERVKCWHCSHGVQRGLCDGTVSHQSVPTISRCSSSVRFAAVGPVGRRYRSITAWPVPAADSCRLVTCKDEQCCGLQLPQKAKRLVNTLQLPAVTDIWWCDQWDMA